MVLAKAPSVLSISVHVRIEHCWIHVHKLVLLCIHCATGDYQISAPCFWVTPNVVASLSSSVADGETPFYFFLSLSFPTSSARFLFHNSKPCIWGEHTAGHFHLLEILLFLPALCKIHLQKLRQSSKRTDVVRVSVEK